MNNHHLHLIILSIFILIHLVSTFDCDDHAKQDDIPFNSKIQQSPVIIIGLSLNKNFHSNIENLFNVTFLVQCILKGQATERIIHIVQAGSLLGRWSCQRLDVNREYIVFLEPFFDGTYRPVDFKEVPYSDQMDLILEKTCGLSRTYPLTTANDTEATLTNRCPSTVSLDCPLQISKTTIGLSTQNSSFTPTMNSTFIGKNPMDLEVLSLLLAEHPSENLGLTFSQADNHKSLFSDDETRKNRANQFSSILLIDLFIFSILPMIF